MKTYSTEGNHIVVDMWGVDYDDLNSGGYLEALLVIAANKARATVLNSYHKEFDPCGVTAVAVLSESHITIHTYPEHGFCAVDCYTCGSNVDPQIAIDYLLKELNPKEYSFAKIKRGTGRLGVIVG